MRSSSNILCQAGLVSACACACLAQANQTVAVPQIAVRSGQFSAGMPSAWFSTGGPVGGNRFQQATGAPYSAEETAEHVQTLTDGTHITQTNMQSKLYRDSAGRTRTELTILPNGAAAGMAVPSFIDIVDPVAGYHYMLDQRSHTAHRAKWSPKVFSRPLTQNPGPTTASSSAGTATVTSEASRHPHPEMTREPLGTQNIEGVTATGSRTTITYPEGFFGNDRPLTVTSETWTSADLKMAILSTSSDPRYGDTTTRLTNIIQAEPDPSLFQIPDDYTLTDQAEGGISFDPAPKR